MNAQTQTKIRPIFLKELKKFSKMVGEGKTEIFEILGQSVKIVQGEFPENGDSENVGGRFTNDDGHKFYFFIQ